MNSIDANGTVANVSYGTTHGPRSAILPRYHRSGRPATVRRSAMLCLVEGLRHAMGGLEGGMA